MKNLQILNVLIVQIFQASDDLVGQRVSFAAPIYEINFSSISLLKIFEIFSDPRQS